MPVSGAFGTGEYARSLAIAEGAQARWPEASLHFLLSRAAPYAASVPFPATLLESSPTFHSAEVIGLLESWRPDVVIFDNAGRTAQLSAARRCGARVVYISARRRQRRKAFRLRWMRLIDEHWIAYPRFLAGDFSWLERFKQRLIGGPRVRFLDVVWSGGAGADSGPTHGADAPVVLVPGGGTGHPGAPRAVEVFLDAARELAARGAATVLVGSATSGAEAAIEPEARLTRLAALPQAQLAALMRRARLIVANGGSTLIQAIACGKPCIAVPIAGDQPERVRLCVAAGVAVAASLDASAIGRAAARLLEDGPAAQALAARAQALGLADGVEVAVAALAALLETK